MRTTIKSVTSAAALLLLHFNPALAVVKAADTGGQAGGAAVRYGAGGSGSIAMAVVGLLVGAALIWLGLRFLNRGAPKDRAAGIAELAFDPADKSIRTKSVVEGVLILLAGALVIIVALWWAIG